MSVAPQWGGSGTTAMRWFLDFLAQGCDWMYGLTDAMRRVVLLSLIPASWSNPLKEMVNWYQFKYQNFLNEVTEEVFTKANDNEILEAFHTVKPGMYWQSFVKKRDWTVRMLLFCFWIDASICLGCQNSSFVTMHALSTLNF